MKNSENKITIHFEDLMDFYDLYVNGLNVIASGTLYLTGDSGLLESEEAIMLGGIDSGETGMQYDFEVISDYCIKVSDFQPNGAGELDFIFVDGNQLFKLSGLYDYGYQKINITVSDGFGVIPLSAIENITANDLYTLEDDPWVTYDGNESTSCRYSYNQFFGYLTFTFTEERPVSAVRFLASPPNETSSMYVQWATTLAGAGDWQTVSNGPKAYSLLHWGNEWFDYNFGETITAKYFRIVMSTFVVPITMYEVEWYGSALSIEEEPVEQFVVDYAVASDPQSGSTYDLLIDGDTGTGMNYGYLVSTKTLSIYAKQRAKIGKIRTYHSRLDSPDWIKIEILTSYLGGSWVEVVPQTSHTGIWQGVWREFDLSANQYYGAGIRVITGTGFVTSDILAEIEVDPW